MAKKEQKQEIVIDPIVYEILEDNDLERAQRIFDLQRRLERIEERIAEEEGVKPGVAGCSI